MSFEQRFEFAVGEEAPLRGVVQLEDVSEGPLACREGVLRIEEGEALQLSLTHSRATERFMYLGEEEDFRELHRILDTLDLKVSQQKGGRFPGAFILGPSRTKLVMSGVRDCMRSPAFKSVFARYGEGELVAVPILREGMKYGLAEGLLRVGGRVCDEIVVDAHHVEDSSVLGLGRRMELSIFKDKDLSEVERDAVKVAVVGDSVASGTVIVGMVEALAKRFPNLERIELVAPLAALYGLARIAAFVRSEVKIRIHAFETLLNALPPDYYFSPFYMDPEMHIRPDVLASYRDWWGRDGEGRWIADTACAGYAWSEAFFSPRKQLRMIDTELTRRHGLRLAELLSR